MKKTISLWILFFWILTGCSITSGIKISSDYKDINYGQLSTYAWYEAAELNAKVDPLILNHITETIDEELSKKGFKKSNNPDFLINFSVTASQVYDVSSYLTYSGYAPAFTWSRNGYGFSKLEKQTQLDLFRKGSLVVDILDPIENILIWRGIAQKRLPDQPYNKEKRDQLIKEAVQQVLSNFPPK